jgi:hypothetical protein
MAFPTLDMKRLMGFYFQAADYWLILVPCHPHFTTFACPT